MVLVARDGLRHGYGAFLLAHKIQGAAVCGQEIGVGGGLRKLLQVRKLLLHLVERNVAGLRLSEHNVRI